MAAKAKAPWDGTPFVAWDEEDTAKQYTKPEYLAGWAAFYALAHSQNMGPDMARVERLTIPADCYHEDMWDFLQELVTQAGELGYRLAKIEASIGPDLTSADVSRAVAAMNRLDLIADGQTFDPEWLAKRSAHDKNRIEEAA